MFPRSRQLWCAEPFSCFPNSCILSERGRTPRDSTLFHSPFCRRLYHFSIKAQIAIVWTVCTCKLRSWMCPIRKSGERKENNKLLTRKLHPPIGSTRHMVASERHDWLPWRLLLPTTPRALGTSSALHLLVCSVCLYFCLSVAVLNLNCFIASGARKKILFPSFSIQIWCSANL